MVPPALKTTTATPAYVIPVVFHVLHNGGISNLPSAKILEQVAILNAEFKRLHADTVLTPPAFAPLAAGLDIEFRLATLDPQGNCTNGIHRVYTTLFDCSNVDSACKLAYWPPDRYLNIWVGENFKLDNFLGSSNGNCYPLGIGTWPWVTAMRQGCIISSSAIRNINNQVNTKGRNLVHEVGHFLNLRHIWGDAACGNDSVADTPPALGPNSGCPTFPRNPLNACGSSSLGEMFCNYMDYTFESCQNMFTSGQVARMTACLNSTVGARNNLWTTANLTSTGTNDPYVYPAPCPAAPEMLPYGTVLLCAGDSVKFTDVSYGGGVSSRLWGFSGGLSSSLTDSVVRVNYPMPGSYDVTLTVGYNAAFKTRVFEKKVTVLDNSTLLGLPYSNGFETDAEAMQWQKINYEQDTTWRVFPAVAFTGSRSVGLANYFNNYPLVDELVSPRLDVAGTGSLKLTFKRHFTRKHASKDALAIRYSENCGATWNLAYTRSGAGLSTSTATFAAAHLPADQSEWKADSIFIDLSPGVGELLLKFSFTSDAGNHVFIDDILLEALSGVGWQEQQWLPQVRVFPNPATQQICIETAGPVQAALTAHLFTVSGLEVLAADLGPEPGLHKVELHDLAPGLYMLTVCSQGHTVSTTKVALLK